VTLLLHAGYGNISPKSSAGRAFTVIFAMFGIPLQMATLAAIGGWLNRAFDRCFLRPCHFGRLARSFGA